MLVGVVKNVQESDIAVGRFVLRSEVIYTGGIWMTAEVMCVWEGVAAM
jgi:hypothetical protein